MSNTDTEDNNLGFYEEPAIKRAKYEPISIDIDEEFDNFLHEMFAQETMNEEEGDKGGLDGGQIGMERVKHVLNIYVLNIYVLNRYVLRSVTGRTGWR